MNLKKLALGAAAGAALLSAAPVFANPPGWAPAYGWRAPQRHPHYHYRAPAYVYYPARPVLVVPAPYYTAPRPVVVRAAPVIYGNIPVGPNVNIGFGVRF